MFKTLQTDFSRFSTDEQGHWIKNLKLTWSPFFEEELALRTTADLPLGYAPLGLQLHSFVLTLPTGQLLSDWRPHTASDFFSFAHALISEVSAFHRAGIALYAVNPHNIIYDAEKARVYFIELFVARSMAASNGTTSARPISMPSGLAYIAPEQTGRTQAQASRISDLFSIGVLLLKVLIGVNPFLGTDQLNTIYRLLTVSHQQVPLIIDGLHPGIWKILEHLLHKNPEKRYASTEYILADLKRLEGLPLDVSFEGNPLSAKAFNWQEVQTLEAPLKAMSGFYQELELSQSHGLLLVEGAEGTGKNLLGKMFISKLPNPVLSVQVDFDEAEPRPFTTFSELLNRLAEYAFTLQEDQLKQLKKELKRALQNNAVLLTELSPVLHKLFPADQEVPKLPPLETQNRLAFALSNFLQSFHRCQIPLVLQFKNCQFASAIYLQILNQILYENPLGTLLIVLFYSDSSGKVPSRFELFTKQWLTAEANLAVQQIHIKAWDFATIQNILIQQRISPAFLQATAQVLLQKTGGNPALIRQLLDRATLEQHLIFEEPQQSFVPDLAALELYEAAESVSQLQISAVDRLAAPLSQLLEIAALLGRKFTIETACKIAKLPIEQGEELLLQLQKAGLIRFSDDEAGSAYFTTMGLPEALQQRMPPAQKQNLVKALLAVEGSNKTPFEVLQYVLYLPPDQSLPYAELLEKGIEEAIQGQAFDRAYHFLAHRYAQFTELDWINQSEKCFKTGLICLRYAVFSEDSGASDHWIAQIKMRADDKSKRAQWAIVSAELYTMQARYQETFDALFPVLEQFGIRLNTQPGIFSIIRAVVLLDQSMRGKNLTYLQKLPNAQDSNTYLKARLLQALGTAVFLSAPQITPLLMSLQIRLGLRHGLSEATTVAFASYAFKLAAFDHQYVRANEMIEMAQQLNARYPNPLAVCVINFLDGTFVKHYTHPLPQVVRFLQENHHYSKANGVLSMAYYSASSAGLYDFFSGTPLSELSAQYLPYLRQSEVNGIETSSVLLRILLQAVESLSASAWSERPLNGTWFKFPASLQEIDHLGNRNNAFVIRVLYFLSNAIQGIADDAADYVGFYLKNWRNYSPGTVSYALFRLLMVLQCCKTPQRLTRKLKAHLQTFIGELQRLSQHNPASGLSRFYLASGTWAEFQNQTAQALQYYEQAIESAISYENNIELLLSLEAKAKLLAKLGLQLQSQATLHLVWQRANAWGCLAKCNQLKVAYPELTFGQGHAEDFANTQGLDLLSFIRASTSINSEIKLEQLLEKLLHILAENAGSQRSVLLLPHGRQWMIYAQQLVNKRIDLAMIPAEDGQLPMMMLQFAQQSQQALALHNAQADRHYGQDPYIQHNHILSALCLPIVKNQQVKAVVYLENNSTPGVFNQQRLEVLQLLSSQIAIALENALLYDEMETRINQRTKELQAAMYQSEELLLNILPKDVAQELKETGRASARLYPQASVMFTDFVNFTQISEKMHPEELVRELDYCFRSFDAIIGHYDIEKIKTIGDAYLCVSGLPMSTPDHALNIVNAAIDIRQFIAQYNQQRITAGGAHFDVRIGIDSGPVVAGVVGSSKFAYDIWGNTVNTAARMEQNSEPGKINVSGETWSLVREHFNFTHRGKISAKNKGEIDMYFVG